MPPRHHVRVCALAFALTACGGSAINSPTVEQPLPEPDAGSPDALAPDAASSDGISTDVAASDSFPETAVSESGNGHTAIAVGSVCTYYSSNWSCAPRFWSADLDALAALPPVELGPPGIVPRGLARLGTRYFVLASDGNVWVVHEGAVQLLDLASQVGATLTPFGIHAEGNTLFVISRHDAEPELIEVWSGDGQDLQRTTTHLDPSVLVGATNVDSGKLYAAWQSDAGVGFAWLEGSSWSTQTLSPTLARGVYDIAVEGDVARMAGDLESGVGVEWGGGGSTKAWTVQLTDPGMGTIATALSRDGSNTYVAGVSSDGPDFVVTTPVYWRIPDGGDPVLTKLGSVVKAEAWVSAINARQGSVVVAGTDGAVPALWVDGVKLALEDGTWTTPPNIWGLQVEW